MIVCRIEMWPHGDESKKRMLGVVTLTNDGTGTLQCGNYNVVASHAGDYFGKRREPYKKARLIGFLRKLSPYRLLCRALKSLGEV